MQVLFIFSLLYQAQAFLRPFRIESREIRSRQTITKDPLFKEIKGFYGLIGPDVNASSITSLYELFTGDGIIQGAFFDKGKITFVKHFVRTEKLLYESDHGRFSKNIFITPFYIFLNKIKLIPNVLGLANTALLQINKKVYALFERDNPYEIKIDLENQVIKTVKKKNILNLSHFSAHSKYENNIIHTLDYDVLCNTISYTRLNKWYYPLSTKIIKTEYMPLIHDFVLLKNRILFLDAPFKWDIKFSNKIPVIFDHKQPAYISVYDTIKQQTQKWIIREPFYIFHYAIVEEMPSGVTIYAPVYDDIDFSSMSITGKYRSISLRQSGEVVIKKNAVLENMNVDFPKKIGRYVVLRVIENHAITGFVLCLGLNIIRRIRLPYNRVFCGEPEIIEIKGESFLVGFSYDENNMGYISLIGVFNNIYREHIIDYPVTVGFHSIFYS
jgi:hypothetical protein